MVESTIMMKKKMRWVKRKLFKPNSLNKLTWNWFFQINNNSFKENSDESDESNNEMQVSDGDEDDDDEPPIKLKRSQYTLDVLQSWYNAKFVDKSDGTKPKLTIIMPNFEEFKPSVLKDLILILR